MLLLALSVAFASPTADATWTTLLEQPVLVECTGEKGPEPFCRATARFAGATPLLASTLADMPDHSEKFESIVSVVRVEPDTMHVVMDFPWPLADRDYVARYVRTDRPDGGMTLAWTSVAHAKAPPTDDVVRLENFSGSWALTPLPDGRTEVVYTWHALYGGALPDQALNTARKKTGQEALKDLASAAGGLTYTSPVD